MADADRLVAALRYQQEMEDASRPVTVNPLMARKAEAIKQNAPAENMLTQYAETMPQNWQQFGQNMAQAYPTPATGASRDQILGAVTQAAVNAGPLMTVFHGSPHRFDKFDASKIGTGEGAQAYGHGLYLAENPSVATDYARTLGPRTALSSPEYVAAQARLAKFEDAVSKRYKQDALSPMEDIAFYSEKYPKRVINAADKIQTAEQAAYEKATKGNLYKVDLPDEQIAKMLDWDKPLQEMGGIKIKPVAKNYDGPFGTGEYGGYAWHLGDTQISRAHRTPDATQKYAPRGSEIIAELNAISGRPMGHSEMLSKAGIPGIRYLDAHSRGHQVNLSIRGKPYETETNRFPSLQSAQQYAAQKASEGFETKIVQTGTSNFVVFPGNEGLLKILERM